MNNQEKNKKPDEPNILAQVGLSDKEALVYESLLKLGKIPVSNLVASLSQKRSTVYSVLEELIKKGLVEKDQSEAVDKFRAKHPYSLKQYIETQVEQIKKADSQLEAVLPSYISLYHQAQNQPGIKFYEGKEGMNQVLNDSLTSKTEILTYVDIEAIMKFIPDINAQYVKKREKLGIKKRGIIIDTPAARKYLANYDTQVTDSKLITAAATPAKTIMQIYDNKISYITLTDENMIGLIVSDKNIYQMHKSLFEFSWKTIPEFKASV
jgi:HTH-type transcriptional regulator, sugar sensing transcriptional regulator